MSRKNLFSKMLRLVASHFTPKSERLASDFKVEGYVRILVKDKSGNVIHQDEGKNILLQDGKAEIMNILWDDSWKTIPPDPTREINSQVKSLARLAVGDYGADPATLQTPKSLDATRTSLFHEVWRQDFDASGLTRPAPNTLRSMTTLQSASIPPGNYMGSPYINEASLILSVPGEFASGVTGAGEVNLTHKTFKSFPFDPGLSMSATVQWDLYIVL